MILFARFNPIYVRTYIITFYGKASEKNKYFLPNTDKFSTQILTSGPIFCCINLLCTRTVPKMYSFYAKTKSKNEKQKLN